MDTALADQAVLKFMRGPTSTTAASPSKNELSAVFSGSNVSLSSHSSTERSSAESGASSAMLKHSSASMPVRLLDTDCCAFASSVARLESDRPGRL